MEWLGVALLVLGLPLALVIWLSARVIQARERLAELSARLSRVEEELAILRGRLPRSPAAAPAEVPGAPAPVGAAVPVATVVQTAPLASSAAPAPAQPLPPRVAPESEPSFVKPAKPAPPPPLPPPLVVPALPPTLAPEPAAASVEPGLLERLSSGKIDWEKFVGVNLLMWLGGLAAFLTVVFAIKYSFDRNWITPELRVAAGFLVGAGLLVAGVVLHRRKQYIVGAQTFCATGILILYATTFACRSVYKFEFFGVVPTFLLMALITATAFVLAVRLDARVVAVLGLVGGFLTPLLLSENKDNPLGLFGYIALLDLGLLAVALRKRWHFLASLGATGTVLMQLGWVSEFFVSERYFEGNKIFVALTVFLGFGALFLAAWFRDRRAHAEVPWLFGPAILVPAVALAFGFYLLDFQPLGQRPGLLFGYVLLADLALLSLVWAEARFAALQLAAGAGVFLFLTVWTLRHVSDDLLHWGLGACLLFAVLHSAVPFVLQRLRPGASPLWWGHLFPPVALVLLLVPIFKLDHASVMLWPVALLVDVLVLVLAVVSGSVLWILLAVGLTLFAVGCWIVRVPAQITELPMELVLIGGFAVFFVGAGVWAARRLGSADIARTGGHSGTGPASGPGLAVLPPDALAAQVPAFSAVLPFVLLLTVVMRLPLADPSPVFGLALLLVVLLLGLSRIFPLTWLPAVGLGCVLALEHTWHLARFSPDAATVPLLWYLAFTLVFAAFPFLFWRQLSGHVVPWATAALAGPLHFYLVHRLVKAAWPNDYMGLLPVAFALPSMASLGFLLRSLAADAPRRNTLLAFFGAAALFFVTLIFPIQFERQWITLGWALEGAALLWLFHRVPHPGLRIAGVGLLVVAFVRLALNPAVLEYHVRSEAALLNWYLYAYSLTTVCLFAGAHLLAPPRHQVLNVDARPLLCTLGTVLAFLLLNIEIADYFTAPGAAVLTFQFSGNLARDMSYSIGWGVFSLVLVGVGVLRKVRAARYAGVVLLCVTLLKLFLRDLSQLQALYRIGALLGLAIVAIASSFLYQRFFAGAESSAPRTPPPTPPAS